jgi:hypothetical protein
MCKGVPGPGTRYQLNPFDFIWPILLIGTGILLILTTSVMQDEDGRLVKISVQWIIGIGLVALGVLGVIRLI